jgi:hypothetical protein
LPTASENVRDGLFNYLIDKGDFTSQVTAAIAFLQEHAHSLQEAFADGSILDGAEMDFGVWRDDTKFSQSFRFPTSISASAAACGVTLCVTVYAGSDPN